MRNTIVLGAMAFLYVPYGLYVWGNITLQSFLICVFISWVVWSILLNEYEDVSLLHSALFWAIFLPVWYYSLYLINTHTEGNFRTFLIVVHLISLGVGIWLFQLGLWLRWRRDRLAKIATSTDVAWLRSEFLDNDYTAEYLRKATRKRIAELED